MFENQAIINEPTVKKKSRTLTIIAIVLAVIVLIVAGVYVWYLITDRNYKGEVNNITISNITSNSATLSWTTYTKYPGEIEISTDNKFFILSFLQNNKKFYDTRDIEEISQGKYELIDKGKYYSHHVTIYGLDPETEYNYRFNTGIFTTSLGGSINTFPIRESIKTPNPIYGYVFDQYGETYDDVIVRAYVKNPTDGVSQNLTSVTDNGTGWSMDIGTIYSVTGQEMTFEKDWTLVVEAIGPYAKKTIEVPNTKIKPVDNIVLEKLSFIETQNDQLKDFSESSNSLLINQVFADACSKIPVEDCEAFASIGCEVRSGRCVMRAAPINPPAENKCGDGECDTGENCAQDCTCGNDKCDDLDKKNGCEEECEDGRQNCQWQYFCGPFIEVDKSNKLCNIDDTAKKTLGNRGCDRCDLLLSIDACNQVGEGLNLGCTWDYTKGVCKSKTSITNEIPAKKYFCDDTGASLARCKEGDPNDCEIPKRCLSGICIENESGDDYCENFYEHNQEGQNEQGLLGGDFGKLSCGEAYLENRVEHNALDGESCTWTGSTHNCVYGFTCQSSMCILDQYNSACQASQVINDGLCSGKPSYISDEIWKKEKNKVNSLDTEEMWREIYNKECGCNSNTDAKCENCVNYGGLILTSGDTGCLASGSTLQCGTWINTISNCAKYDILEHEVGHYIQLFKSDKEYLDKLNEGKLSDLAGCGFVSGSNYTFCRTVATEVGAEARSNNGGGYIFYDSNGNEKCGTQVYEDVKSDIGQTLADGILKNASCESYSLALEKNYDFCSKYPSAILNYATYSLKCRTDEVLVGVTTSQGSSILENIFINKVKAQDTQYEGMYTPSVEGYQTTSKYIFYSPGQEVKVFNDLNKDGIKQENEPILDTVTVELESQIHFTDYDMLKGWNLISIPMVISDANGRTIQDSQQLLTYFQSQDIPIMHISTYRDGKWMISSRRGDIPYGENFSILPGEAYFVKAESKISFRLNGHRFTENPNYDLNIGWNLIGIPNPIKDMTADTLINNDNEILSSDIDTVSKWENGQYKNYLSIDDTDYGFDYKLFPNAGYFVRVK
ncbi:MAG TPA: fibronectin type III domain-containing protein [Candidatus Dojkabacteria bacterium]|nr:fibronectin type III domain-containing protein [Candidatus Dojkabacteria bacterium]